jgi:hypothetical protein
MIRALLACILFLLPLHAESTTPDAIAKEIIATEGEVRD